MKKDKKTQTASESETLKVTVATAIAELPLHVEVKDLFKPRTATAGFDTKGPKHVHAWER